MAGFNWEPRIARDMQTIEHILRRDNMDTTLGNKAFYAIEAEIRRLVEDVQTQTREDLEKETNK